MKTVQPFVGELFPLPALPAVVRRQVCTRENYVASCTERYRGIWLADALQNWETYEERREVFTNWCDHYKRDPQMMVGHKAHNPRGTLTSMVWVMQLALEPDRSRLDPCLDFEEYFQTVFIRRGLMIYLTLLLKELEDCTSPRPSPPSGEGENTEGKS